MNLPVIKSTVWVMELQNIPDEFITKRDSLTMQKQDGISPEDYLNLYREVGKDYIWNYRPSNTRKELVELLESPNTQLYFFYEGEKTIGFAEISQKDSVFEIVHFGLIPSYIQKGYGSYFFSKILKTLLGQNHSKIWLSTCGLDHPNAVNFYKKHGFELTSTKENVEFQDYRYTDFYDLTDAPQIPLAGT